MPELEKAPLILTRSLVLNYSRELIHIWKIILSEKSSQKIKNNQNNMLSLFMQLCLNISQYNSVCQAADFNWVRPCYFEINKIMELAALPSGGKLDF